MADMVRYKLVMMLLVLFTEIYKYFLYINSGYQMATGIGYFHEWKVIPLHYINNFFL